MASGGGRAVCGGIKGGGGGTGWRGVVVMIQLGCVVVVVVVVVFHLSNNGILVLRIGLCLEFLSFLFFLYLSPKFLNH